MSENQEKGVKVRVRRSKAKRFLRQAATTVGIVVLVIAGILIAWKQVATQRRVSAAVLAQPVASPVALPDNPDLAPATTAKPTAKYKGHPVYPYSVIPGGVHSVEALRVVMLNDAAIAAQYPNFDFDKAKVVTLTEDSQAYVSFAKNGQIAWTSKAIALHKGEQVITDGTYQIRTRCGNGISYVPKVPTMPVDVAEMEVPVPPFGISSVTPRQSDFVSVDPKGKPQTKLIAKDRLVPIIPAFPGLGKTVTPPTPVTPECDKEKDESCKPPVVVPEPTSGWLLFSCGGLVLLVAVIARRRKAVI